MEGAAASAVPDSEQAIVSASSASKAALLEAVASASPSTSTTEADGGQDAYAQGVAAKAPIVVASVTVAALLATIEPTPGLACAAGRPQRRPFLSAFPSRSLPVSIRKLSSSSRIVSLGRTIAFPLHLYNPDTPRGSRRRVLAGALPSCQATRSALPATAGKSPGRWFPRRASGPACRPSGRACTSRSASPASPGRCRPMPGW